MPIHKPYSFIDKLAVIASIKHGESQAMSQSVPESTIHGQLRDGCANIYREFSKLKYSLKKTFSILIILSAHIFHSLMLIHVIASMTLPCDVN